MPMWEDLRKMKERKANMIQMNADTYMNTPLASQKTIEGVPTVLFVDKEGHIREATNSRNKEIMTEAVRTGVPEEVAVENIQSQKNRVSTQMTSEPSTDALSTGEEPTKEEPTGEETTEEEPKKNEPKPEATGEQTLQKETIRSSVNPNFVPIIPGTKFAASPLYPLPGTPVPNKNVVVQSGGSPWGAFLVAARQAGPAVALLGAYSTLRSSGLPKARRTRRLKKRSQ
jgi:hypothetical protein